VPRVARSALALEGAVDRRTSSVFVTEDGTLDLLARPAVPAIAEQALALEAADGVGAAGVRVAIIGIGGAFVDIDARGRVALRVLEARGALAARASTDDAARGPVAAGVRELAARVDRRLLLIDDRLLAAALLGIGAFFEVDDGADAGLGQAQGQAARGLRARRVDAGVSEVDAQVDRALGQVAQDAPRDDAACVVIGGQAVLRRASVGADARLDRKFSGVVRLRNHDEPPQIPGVRIAFGGHR